MWQESGWVMAGRGIGLGEGEEGGGKAAAPCLGGRPAPAEPGPLWSWGIFPTPLLPSASLPLPFSLRTLPLGEAQLPAFFLRKVLNDTALGKPGQEAVFRQFLLKALSTNLSGHCSFPEAAPAQGHSPGGLNSGNLLQLMS